jgi:hypothetical protein
MEHETKISLQNYKLYVEGHFMPDWECSYGCFYAEMY